MTDHLNRTALAPPLTRRDFRFLEIGTSLYAASENNWLRRFLYFIGAPRRWTRSV